MKYTIVLLLTLSIVFGGCSEDWLTDVEPQGELFEANYYKTEEDVATAMTAIYNAWKNQYWQDTWASWYLYTSLPSDDAVCHGGGRSDRPEFWEIHDYSVTPITSGVEQIWARIYFGVYRSNVVIANADTETEIGKKAIAEAKMMRALFNFDLVRFFGDAPLLTEVVLPENYFIAGQKSTKNQILDQIVLDLADASVDLPVAWEGSERYRVTKYAAHGLLAKVYMYMTSPSYYEQGSVNELYTKAIEQCNLVINSGVYSLESDYSQIWWYGNEFNKETLIEISYGFQPGDGFKADEEGGGQSFVSNVIQQLQGPRGLLAGDGEIIGGWGFDQPSELLASAYRSEGDSIRLHGTCLAEWQLRERGYDINTDDGVNDAYQGYYSMKRMTWEALNPARTPWGWGNNERILRLADIYLLKAEANIAISGAGAGDDDINFVRARVDLAPKTGATMDDLMLERRLELGMEGQRFFDLVRWEKDIEVLGTIDVDEPSMDIRTPYTINDRFVPIPQSEIEASRGNLVQNDYAL